MCIFLTGEGRGGEGGEWLYQRYFYLIYILLHGFLIGHGFRHYFSSFVYTLRVCECFFTWIFFLLLLCYYSPISLLNIFCFSKCTMIFCAYL